MAFDLASISSAKRMRAPRIVLLGTSGIGKSEFAAGSDNPIMMPIKGEEGIDALDVQTFPVVASYNEAMEVIGTLYQEKHPYKTLVIDSASTFGPIVDTCALQTEGVSGKGILGGGFGHQFDTILILWRQLMNGLDALRDDRNMTIIIIGHVAIKSSRDPDSESFDQWQFDIDKKVASALIKWSDCTLFMSRKTIVKSTEGGFGKKEKKGIDITGGQRFLSADETPTHPGKSRGCFGDLPAEIALPRKDAWGTFMDAVATAASK